MHRPWRRATAAALVGAAAIAAQFTAIASAQAAAPTITISATTKLTGVARATGDEMVVFRGGASALAAIHGTITGGAAGEVAAVYGQQFPFKGPAVRLGSITLKSSAKTAYSFTVAPNFATKYAVRLFRSGTARAPFATSGVQIIYVAELGSFSTPTKSCGGRPVVCHAGFNLFESLPSSALRVEMTKHVFPYFAVNLSPTRQPPPPTTLFLNAGNPRVRVRQLNIGEFEVTLAFTFTVGNNAATWNFLECQRDTLTVDGLGLPGHHGCGNSRISVNAAYIG